MKNCPTCQLTFPDNFAVCPQDGTPLLAVGAWADGTVIRGKYRILNKVGQGGMGAVYKSLHLAFDELRALKVISPELMTDDLFVKRFKHEAVITRRLQHPNAVRVDDIDEAEDGRPFIVMEFIEGQSLKKVIQDAGPLPVPRVCSIIKQTCAALDAAHRIGMIHRDIKPDNIALVPTGEGEQVKVLDFGIAKLKEARAGGTAGMTMTGTGVVIGTPQYMSPEQALGKRGDELDGRSDLYSLGIVMYQMLTGELPFMADTTMGMLLAHLQTPPTPVYDIHPELEIPPPIANLVMRMIEKKPDLRPASGRAVAEEIEQFEKTQAAGAPVGEFPVLRETVVIPRGELHPVTPRAYPTPVSEVPFGGHAAHPSTAAAPRAHVVHPPPVTVAPPRSSPSQWGMWVAVVILAVGLGGAAWYFFGRSPVTPLEPSVPAVTSSSGTTIVPPGPSISTTTTGREASAPRATVPTPAVSTERPASDSTKTTESVTSPPTTIEPPRTSVTTASRPTVTTPSRPAGGSVSISPPRETPTRAPTVDPKKIRAAIALGDMLLERGEYDAAIREYLSGLEVDPANTVLREKVQRARRAKAAEERLQQ